MISAIELENVRVFGSPGTRFRLPMLTVFCGTNSSGKSSVLRSLLLLRQSQGIRESAVTDPGRLRFVGSQVDLGSYSTYVADNDAARPISISLTVEHQEAAWLISMLQHASTDGDPSLVSTPHATARRAPIQCSSEFRFTFHAMHAGNPDHDAWNAKGVRAFPGMLAKLECDCTMGLYKHSWRLSARRDGDADVQYDIEFPTQYLDFFSDVADDIQLGPSELAGCGKADATLNGLVPLWISALRQRSSPSGEMTADPTARRIPTPMQIETPTDAFLAALYRIHYLQPLRSPARRYYLTVSDAMPDLDPSGEFLPYVLGYRVGEEVANVHPGGTAVVREPLSVALNTWLHYLRVGETPASEAICDEFQVHTPADVMVRLDVRSLAGQSLHSLSDSGFGYSQVLPILVRGLLAEPESTLVVEQPELHLNPALQVRLAAFFAAMAAARKQVIIETHSEHLVNSIRVLAAEDESGDLAAQSAIYYLEASSGAPVVHELTIGADGNVPKWPRSFFGEAASLTGRLLRAQKRYRDHTRAGRQ